MKKSWEEWGKKELLNLPQRNWCQLSEYASVLLVNTKMKHSSGYNLFAIIGVDENGIPQEIAGYMDDFRLGSICGTGFPDIVLQDYSVGIDCSMSGVFRIHSHKYKIVVGLSTSTTCFIFKEWK